MPCNKADAVRLACLNGSKIAMKIKNTKSVNVQVIITKNILYIAENKLIMNASPFFYE